MEVFYILSLMVLKISLGLFFLRILVKRWQRRMIYTAMTISTVFSFVMFWFIIFQCGYYTSIFEFIARRVSNTHCASPTATLAMVYTHAGMTTSTDWFFLVVPVFILKGINMKNKEKITVGLLLMFASM
jgi:hypothetical protein